MIVDGYDLGAAGAYELCLPHTARFVDCW